MLRKALLNSVCCSVPVLMCLAGTASASVVISAAPTSNMSCAGSVCSPTARDAMMNVSDVTTFLAAGSVTIKSNDTARDIVVKAAIRWTNDGALILDSKRSVTVERPVIADQREKGLVEPCRLFAAGSDLDVQAAGAKVREPPTLHGRIGILD